MDTYNAIQAQINELTKTPSEERHLKQHREQQACERRLKQMQIKREKELKRKALALKPKESIDG